MKRLLLPVLAALALPSAVEANWFGYGSRYEANEACEEWVVKGGTYQVEYKDYHGQKIYTRNLRECQDDSSTNKVLGLTQKRAVKGGSYDADYLYQGNYKKSRKLIKYFKY